MEARSLVAERGWTVKRDGEVLLAVWLASFLIPSGTFDIDAEMGRPLPGTFEELPPPTSPGAPPAPRDIGRA